MADQDWSGFTRTQVRDWKKDELKLKETPPFIIKKRGAVRGIRLIYMPGLAEALDRLAAKQTATATTQETDPAQRHSSTTEKPAA